MGKKNKSQVADQCKDVSKRLNGVIGRTQWPFHHPGEAEKLAEQVNALAKCVREIVEMLRNT